MSERRWQIWVDTGGTFTDGLAVAPDGGILRAKVLSSSALRGIVSGTRPPSTVEIEASWDAPASLIESLRFRGLSDTRVDLAVRRFDLRSRTLELDGTVKDLRSGSPFELLSAEESPIFAARLLTGTAPPAPLPPCEFRLATTLGTNALLERSGASTALLVTSGFADLLAIGNQQRPDLFALNVVKPEPLCSEVIEVPERLAADGSVLTPLDLTALGPRLKGLRARGIRVAAVALMHAYRNPIHERALAARLRELGIEHVSCSSELAPRIKLLSRAQTSVVDAYLAPVLVNYLDRVRGALDSGDLLVMTSAGGLLAAEGFRPKDGLLSGPAGGVAGASAAGRHSGCARSLTFDMGGTSTDVARFDGDFEYVHEHRVGDATLVAPALAIETVAAGGGSICWFDGERLRVGPQSAGAHPGPACYGAGGPLTLTDVNLLLRRLDAARFSIPVWPEQSQTRFDELRRRVGAPDGSAESMLYGLLEIANETMADAMRGVSLRRGYDPREYTLVAFGGAGGQHACAVAEKLGALQVLIPPDAALLSALGLGHAAIERFREKQVLLELDEAEPKLAEWFAALAEQARESVADAGVDPASIVIRRQSVHLRFAGQDAVVDVEWAPGAVADRFTRKYEQLFGHRPEDRRIEVESIHVAASSPPHDAGKATERPAAYPALPTSRHRAWFDGSWREVPCFERDRLRPGASLDGPALVLEDLSTTVVESGWRATMDARHALRLERDPAGGDVQSGEQPEAIRLELFTQRFATLVGEMGERLERTAVSTNVKERLDFSCALLDPDGELVVNAPHIPVHLGALGLCVRRVAASMHLGPGDVVATNHPGFGGSHLPDVTVITPVFDRGETLLGYTANRAHHAEIGGMRPGSMPPAATRLAQEGVVLRPEHVIRGGRPRWKELRQRLEGAEYPSRAIDDNLADLRAAVAANHAGAEALRNLCTTFGTETVMRYMGSLKRLAADRIGEAVKRLGDGRFEATEHLDDGTPLAVRIDLKDGHARFDFSGSGPVHPGNLNATPAIVHSVVIYVLRLLLPEPLPLNEGLLHAATIEIPPGILNPPFTDDPRNDPAVVGGNVETSQRLVDTLLLALKLAACSQGTMNNVIFGNERYGYYETIGGGVGAGPTNPGACGVHSHMTNTRITDPEILEHRYPVRLERFSFRRGSGGDGRHAGGEGLLRRIRFLDPASVSVLTQHRTVAPYGLDGGRPGACGGQRILLAGGGVRELESVDGYDAKAGDAIEIETPGGGGFGTPRQPGD